MFLWIWHKTKQNEKHMEELSRKNRKVPMSQEEKQVRRKKLVNKLKPSVD